MDNIIKLAGISGSLRTKSYNSFLLNAVKELLPENVSMEILPIGDLPLYNGDLDTPDAAERPPLVAAFRNHLQHADGLVIASPEYNYSIPGGLKNAIDWASRGKDSPIINKPVALMGATPGLWGTVRMQLAFQPVLLTLSMRQVKPEVLVSTAESKFNAEGKLTDETTRALIIRQLQALKTVILQHRGE